MILVGGAVLVLVIAALYYWGQALGAGRLDDNELIGPNKAGGQVTFFIFVAALIALPLGIIALALWMP